MVNDVIRDELRDSPSINTALLMCNIVTSIKLCVNDFRWDIEMNQ